MTHMFCHEVQGERAVDALLGRTDGAVRAGEAGRAQHTHTHTHTDTHTRLARSLVQKFPVALRLLGGEGTGRLCLRGSTHTHTHTDEMNGKFRTYARRLKRNIMRRG